jgi:flagellar basal-body rod protein FlgB
VLTSAMFNGTTVPVLEQMVNFAESRHAVLAGNIANFDTPGYRTRDLSVEKFQTRLSEAIDQRDRYQNTSVFANAATHRQDPFRDASDDLKGVLFHDGSDGTIEQQIAAISKNQMMHNMALTIMTNQFRLLSAAISEKA